MAALALFSLTAKAQQVISLQQAVDSTIKNNLTIKQAQYTEALANEDYKQAKYNQLPILSANPSASYNFGRSANLTTLKAGIQTIKFTSIIFCRPINCSIQSFSAHRMAV